MKGLEQERLILGLIWQSTQQNKEKRMKRNEDSLRELWDNIKRNNIRIIGVPEGEEGEKDSRNYLKTL